MFSRENYSNANKIPTLQRIAYKVDAMESIKTKQPIIQITRNKIYGNNIPRIRLNQRENGETFGIKNDEIFFTHDEDAMENDFKMVFQKVMFGNYYRITEKYGDNVTAECKKCKSIVNDSFSIRKNLRSHLRVCILICELNGEGKKERRKNEK